MMALTQTQRNLRHINKLKREARAWRRIRQWAEDTGHPELLQLLDAALEDDTVLDIPWKRGELPEWLPAELPSLR